MENWLNREALSVHTKGNLVCSQHATLHFPSTDKRSSSMDSALNTAAVVVLSTTLLVLPDEGSYTGTTGSPENMLRLPCFAAHSQNSFNHCRETCDPGKHFFSKTATLLALSLSSCVDLHRATLTSLSCKSSSVVSTI